MHGFKKQLHECSVCGTVGKWNAKWSWYGSIRDLEDGKLIVKTCCNECRNVVRDPENLINIMAMEATKHSTDTQAS